MKTLMMVLTVVLSTVFLAVVSQAQDWAGLTHYQDANHELLAPAPGEQRVVFMGNSITEGWLTKDPEFFKGKPYVNRGIGGQTSPLMLVRFRPDVIELRPAVVVILAGTNDIAGNTGPSTADKIIDNIQSMAQLAQANGIKVVLCSVLPAADYPWSPGQDPLHRIPELNNLIKACALEQNYVFCDYYNAMKNASGGLDSRWSDDGVHPESAGYKVMGQLVEKAIQKALDQ